MKIGTKNYLRAISIMSGTIIGVGIFGIPYVMSKAGVLISIFYFALLGLILVYNHLLYGEAVLRTGLKHRLAGMARIYINKPWEYITLIVTALSFYGAIIAYIIVGGKFLQIILLPFFDISLFISQVIFFVFMAFFVLIGLRLVASAEVLMTGFLLLAVAIIMGAGLPKIDIYNFLPNNLNNFFLPYGVILFSLAGAAAIPEVIEVLSHNKNKIKSSIVWGSIIPIIVSILFGLVVVGVTGFSTTKDAIAGLGMHIGNWILYLGACFGFFAVSTSFLIMALYLRDQFWLDIKIGKFLSWFLACFIPFFIFLFGSRDFIQVIGFTGAVFAGFEGVLIVWLYYLARKKGKRKPEYTILISKLFAGFIVLVFLLGMVYEIWTILK